MKPTDKIYNTIEDLNKENCSDYSLFYCMSIIKNNKNEKALIYLIDKLMLKTNDFTINIYNEINKLKNINNYVNIIKEINNNYELQYTIQNKLNINKICDICMIENKLFSLYRCKTVKHLFCINCVSKMECCPLCKELKYNIKNIN
jgi:hypothetical protein